MSIVAATTSNEYATAAVTSATSAAPAFHDGSVWSSNAIAPNDAALIASPIPSTRPGPIRDANAPSAGKIAVPTTAPTMNAIDDADGETPKPAAHDQGHHVEERLEPEHRQQPGDHEQSEAAVHGPPQLAEARPVVGVEHPADARDLTS